MSDDYVIFDATLKARTAKALLLDTPSGDGWVPRSCLHAATDGDADKAEIGDTIRIRCREWIARERGLI